MGLDMYLIAKKGVFGFEHSSDHKSKALYAELSRLTGIVPTSDSPVFYVQADVSYWRRANAIHRWFVENVQGGSDDGETYLVTADKLAELRHACVRVLSVETVSGKVNEGTTFYPDGRVERHTRDGEVVAQEQMAASILPTSGGFFFGKTDYDEDYLADLRDTVEIIDRVMGDSALKDCDLYYRSSW